MVKELSSIFQLSAFISRSDEVIYSDNLPVFSIKKRVLFRKFNVAFIDGPLLDMKHIQRSALSEFEEAIRSYIYVYLYSNIAYSSDWEFYLRSIGFSSRIAQSKSRLTYIIDPCNYSLSRGAKRNISYFEKKCSYEIKQIVDYNSYEKCMSRKGLRPYTLDLFDDLESDDMTVGFTLFVGREPVSSRLIAISGENAADLLAWQEGSVRGASYFLMNEILCYLKSVSVTTFDFSGLPVGRKGADGVANFKMSFKGGNKSQILGEFSKKSRANKLLEFACNTYEYYTRKY